MSLAAMSSAWSPLDGQGRDSNAMLDERQSSSSMAQQSQQHQLRNSCDACNFAKVRCSKARPACKRCENRNLRCVYGISLRSVKRRRSGSNAGPGEQPKGTRDGPRSKFNHVQKHAPVTTVKPTISCDVLTPVPSTSNSTITGTPRVAAAILPPPPPPLLSDAGFESLMLNCWEMDFVDAGNLGVVSVTDSDVDPGSMDNNNNNRVLHRDSPMDLLAPRLLASTTDSRIFSSNGDPPHANRYHNQQQHHPLPPTLTSNTLSSSSSSTAPCTCQRNILSKLSELTTHRHSAGSSISVPFDEFLTENKAVLAVCMSTLDCAVGEHKDDLILIMTLVTLVVHIIVMYDRVLRSWHRPPGGGGSANPGGSSSGGVAGGGAQNVNQSNQPMSFLPVRLSLGSYQLDQRDEQILQANLLKIELKKVGALIDTFERRFCTPDKELAEANPIADLLAHFKRKLRYNYEAVRAWTPLS